LLLEIAADRALDDEAHLVGSHATAGPKDGSEVTDARRGDGDGRRRGFGGSAADQGAAKTGQAGADDGEG
jgi:hypothetical protein